VQAGGKSGISEIFSENLTELSWERCA